MDNNYVFVYTEGAEDLPTTSMLVRLFSTLEKAQAFMREREAEKFFITVSLQKNCPCKMQGQRIKHRQV